jgi:xanthine dehydrogenase accessory factor
MVVGAGHVGVKVAHLAKWLGYAVVVSDDREELLKDESLKSLGSLHHGPMEELAEAFPIHNRTFLVLTTRNVDVDAAGLPVLLNSDAAYIGVIGSRRRWETTKSKLVELGMDAKKIARVNSPVGLELNAETPEEIAVSIMAQIIMLRHGGDGSSMAK